MRPATQNEVGFWACLILSNIEPWELWYLALAIVFLVLYIKSERAS